MSKLPKGMKSASLQEERTCYAMLLIPIIGFIFLSAYPIIWTFKWAFYSYKGVESEAVWIGLKNFTTLFSKDLTYWRMWWQTIMFAIMKLPMELPLAMILALFLNSKIKGSGFFRTMYYLPSVVSVAVVGVVFSNMFSYWGIINNMLLKLGVIAEEIDWFASQGSAILMLALASTWCTFGVNVMYFLAALTNVPEELYESARLDGASPWTTFWKITMPSIMSVFKIVLLMSITGTLEMNELVLVLTNGAPQSQSFTVMSYLTKQFVPGFAEQAAPNLGYGCAMSVITTILFMVIGLTYNTISKRMDH